MKKREADLLMIGIKHDLCKLTMGTPKEKVSDVKLEVISWVLNNPFSPGIRQRAQWTKKARETD